MPAPQPLAAQPEDFRLCEGIGAHHNATSTRNGCMAAPIARKAETALRQARRSQSPRRAGMTLCATSLLTKSLPRFAEEPNSSPQPLAGFLTGDQRAEVKP